MIDKSTTGSTVMFTDEALLSSGFDSLSVLFTMTILETVPFNLAFTQIVKVAYSKTLRSPIVHKPVSGLYVVPADATKRSPVSSTSSLNVSFTTTLVALQGPLFWT